VIQAPKRPVSVLVLIHTPQLEVLLLERASHPGYWQSVTGSQECQEDLASTALREVAEETSIRGHPQELDDWQTINRFRIFDEWLHRYVPGVNYNTEHVFSLAVPCGTPVRLNPEEHLAYRWLPWQEAARDCFSWSNRDAVLLLPKRTNYSNS
jgi:dihydroneopterin triphosphate diphosphatase